MFFMLLYYIYIHIYINKKKTFLLWKKKKSKLNCVASFWRSYMLWMFCQSGSYRFLLRHCFSRCVCVYSFSSADIKPTTSPPLQLNPHSRESLNLEPHCALIKDPHHGLSRRTNLVHLCHLPHYMIMICTQFVCCLSYAVQMVTHCALQCVAQRIFHHLLVKGLNQVCLWILKVWLGFSL